MSTSRNKKTSNGLETWEAGFNCLETVITQQEAAELAQVDHKTISRWINEGQLPWRQAGRNVLVYRPALENFLATASGFTKTKNRINLR